MKFEATSYIIIGKIPSHSLKHKTKLFPHPYKHEIYLYHMNMYVYNIPICYVCNKDKSLPFSNDFLYICSCRFLYFASLANLSIFTFHFQHINMYEINFFLSFIYKSFFFLFSPFCFFSLSCLFSVLSSLGLIYGIIAVDFWGNVVSLRAFLGVFDYLHY